MFKIIDNPNKDEILQMIELDKAVYKNSKDVGVLDICLMWQKKCPELYTAIKLNGRVIAYINMICVTKTAYDQIKSGHKKDYELTLNDILPFQVGDNYCFFVSIVIDEKYRNTMAIMMLFNALKNKVERFKKYGIKIKSVLADCVTDSGTNLITKFTKRFKAQCVGKTKTGSLIFEFDLNK